MLPVAGLPDGVLAGDGEEQGGRSRFGMVRSPA